MQETPQQRAERIEPMLAAAGFHMLPADTPERVAETQRLTPLKVRYFIDNGKPRYWFNDPVNCHCVYVGSEKNYQQYEQIRLSQQAARQEAEAAQMNEEAAEQEQMNMMMWPGPFIMYCLPYLAGYRGHHLLRRRTWRRAMARSWGQIVGDRVVRSSRRGRQSDRTALRAQGS